jgi:hypothetical protein
MLVKLLELTQPLGEFFRLLNQFRRIFANLFLRNFFAESRSVKNNLASPTVSQGGDHPRYDFK